MKLLNPIYLVAVLVAVFLWKYVSDYSQQSILFFGFTENKETEINLNHAAEINQILVTAGQSVKQGDILLEVSHVEFEHDINQNQDRIEELKIKEQLWLASRKGQLDILFAEKRLKIEELAARIAQLRSEESHKVDLFEGLKSIDQNSTKTYNPVGEKITALEQEKTLLTDALNTEISTQQKELELGNNPYRQQIKSLKAEITLNQNRIEKLSIPAPTDGLIGTIQCKEAEHIQAFNTLITFYESKPSLVKGYIHENLSLHVAIGDTLVVKASKDANLHCKGIVTGLGSRIIEIPSRLRKRPEQKTYGREVLIKIPIANEFLQKEKVVLHFLEEKEKAVHEDIRRQEALAKKMQRE